MPRYIAFLRAINVGGHVVKMDRLRALFEELGLRNVETFIASGNVIFETPKRGANALERAIQSHLQSALGYAVDTFLRTPKELAVTAGLQPFPGFEASNHYVGFIKGAPPDDMRRALLALRNDENNLHVEGREVFWLWHSQDPDAKFVAPPIERVLRGPLTFRNVTTVRKLAAKYPS